jgi:hypothetical protein
MNIGNGGAVYNLYVLHIRTTVIGHRIEINAAG